jgi:hypothetical protein
MCLCVMLPCVLAARGRLAFASQFIFKRLGRALLVPIYRQIVRMDRSSAISQELMKALHWWLQTLKHGMCEVTRPWARHRWHCVCYCFLCRCGPGARSQQRRYSCYAMQGGLLHIRSTLGLTRDVVRNRSTPPRVAAVLFIDGEILYADCAPDAKILGQSKPRNDHQIASLEMLAIAYGASASEPCCECAHECAVWVCVCRPVDFRG